MSRSASAGAAGAGEIDSLRLGKAGGGLIELDWSPSCSPGANDYAVYEGRLSALYNHTIKTCSDAADAVPLRETVDPISPDAYYLVVPIGAAGEGSYGRSSSAS